MKFNNVSKVGILRAIWTDPGLWDSYYSDSTGDRRVNLSHDKKNKEIVITLEAGGATHGMRSFHVYVTMTNGVIYKFNVGTNSY
jgi:hypothetical protein